MVLTTCLPTAVSPKQLEHYLDWRLSLVPCQTGNKAKVPFARRHNDRRYHRIVLASHAELAAWRRAHSYPHNWGVLGLVQADCDSSEAERWLATVGVSSSEPVWILKSSRGLKVMFRAPADCPRNAGHGDDLGKPDLLGPRTMLLVPPSIHPSGFRYAWVRGHGPADIPYSELPEPPATLTSYWRQVAAPPRTRINSRGAPDYLNLIFDAIVSRLEGQGLRLRPTSDGGLQGDCPFHHSQGHKAFSIHPERGWLCFAGCGHGRLTQLAVRLGVTEFIHA